MRRVLYTWTYIVRGCICLTDSVMWAVNSLVDQRAVLQINTPFVSYKTENAIGRFRSGGDRDVDALISAV